MRKTKKDCGIYLEDDNQIYLISVQEYEYHTSPMKDNRSVMNAEYCHLTAGM